MTSADAKPLLEEFAEASNRHDVAAVPGAMAQDCVRKQRT